LIFDGICDRLPLGTSDLTFGVVRVTEGGSDGSTDFALGTSEIDGVESDGLVEGFAVPESLGKSDIAVATFVGGLVLIEVGKSELP
jgi:hypothetical protein